MRRAQDGPGTLPSEELQGKHWADARKGEVCGVFSSRSLAQGAEGFQRVPAKYSKTPCP